MPPYFLKKCDDGKWYILYTSSDKVKAGPYLTEKDGQIALKEYLDIRGLLDK